MKRKNGSKIKTDQVKEQHMMYKGKRYRLTQGARFFLLCIMVMGAGFIEGAVDFNGILFGFIVALVPGIIALTM